MRSMARLVAPFVTLVLGACGDPAGPEPIERLPRPLTATEQAVVSASNRFSFHLLREVAAARPGGNLFLSPLSASMALGMTMNGARGSTSEAMRATLGFDALSQPEINRSYRGLIDLLRGLDPKVQMLVANSIWYRNTFPFHQAFFDTTRVYFDARVAGLNFDDPASVGTINGWAKESTRGKIDSIVERIDARDVMYLINAIYFKGDWTKQFDRSQTRDAPFFDAAGRQPVGTVKMMNRKGPILLYRGPDFQAAELPYGGGAFAMTILLPDRGSSANALLASLTPARWNEIVAGLAEASYEVSLPRFRLEQKQALDEALRAMGMGIALGAGATDFTGMSPRGRDLFISSVVQKTFVEVNEEGTEAAAVTKVTMGVTSAPPAFVADRPFLFAIRERLSGTILFIGRMEKPE